MQGIEQLSELSGLLSRYVPDRRISNNVLSKFMMIFDKTERAIFDLNWDNVYLHSITNEWVKASTIIIDGNQDIDNQHLHSEYSEKVISFLKEKLPKDALINKLSGNQKFK